MGGEELTSEEILHFLSLHLRLRMNISSFPCLSSLKKINGGSHALSTRSPLLAFLTICLLTACAIGLVITIITDSCPSSVSLATIAIAHPERKTRL